MTHPDYVAFLRAIIAAPDDDLPRLVMADWLDEQGEPERAEFIRVQCDLAPRTPCSVQSDFDSQGRECCWYCHLKRRERELLRANIGGWTSELPEELIIRECPHCVGRAADWETNVVECSHCECTGVVLDEDAVEFHRGFVSVIRVSWDVWQHSADLFLAACPIRNAKGGVVRLSTWPDVDWLFNHGMLIGQPIELPAMLAREWPGVRFDTTTCDTSPPILIPGTS